MALAESCATLLREWGSCRDDWGSLSLVFWVLRGWGFSAQAGFVCRAWVMVLLFTDSVLMFSQNPRQMFTVRFLSEDRPSSVSLIKLIPSPQLPNNGSLAIPCADQPVEDWEALITFLMTMMPPWTFPIWFPFYIVGIKPCHVFAQQDADK